MFDSDPYDEWMETINKLGELDLSPRPTTVKSLTGTQAQILNASLQRSKNMQRNNKRLAVAQNSSSDSTAAPTGGVCSGGCAMRWLKRKRISGTPARDRRGGGICIETKFVV